MKNLLLCNHCGYVGPQAHYDENQYGHWCPCCNKFTITAPKYKNSIFNLYVTKKAKADMNKVVNYAFNKKLSPKRTHFTNGKLVDLLYAKMDKRRTTFVDVFCQDAQIGLAYLEKKAINHLVLNVNDRGVYALFHQILTDPQTLIKAIEEYEPKRENYFFYNRMAYRGYDDADMLQAAMACLVVDKLSFAGIANAESKANLNDRWNGKELVKRVKRIYEMRDQISLINDSPQTVIDNYYWYDDTTILIKAPQRFLENGISSQIEQLLESYPGGADVFITKMNEVKQIIPERFTINVSENIS